MTGYFFKYHHGWTRGNRTAIWCVQNVYEIKKGSKAKSCLWTNLLTFPESFFAVYSVFLRSEWITSRNLLFLISPVLFCLWQFFLLLDWSHFSGFKGPGWRSYQTLLISQFDRNEKDLANYRRTYSVTRYPLWPSTDDNDLNSNGMSFVYCLIFCPLW